MKWIGETSEGNNLVELTPDEFRVMITTQARIRPEAGSIGDAVRRYRRKRGISQRQLADRLRISRNYVGMIERGEATNYSHEMYMRVIEEINKE